MFTCRVLTLEPHATLRCQNHDPRTNTTGGCGEGVEQHTRTFLHGCARVTLSVGQAANGETLPGEDRHQVSIHNPSPGLKGGRGGRRLMARCCQGGPAPGEGTTLVLVGRMGASGGQAPG